jgi:hypothetical protein
MINKICVYSCGHAHVIQEEGRVARGLDKGQLLASSQRVNRFAFQDPKSYFYKKKKNDKGVSYAVLCIIVFMRDT